MWFLTVLTGLLAAGLVPDDPFASLQSFIDSAAQHADTGDQDQAAFNMKMAMQWINQNPHRFPGPGWRPWGLMVDVMHFLPQTIQNGLLAMIKNEAVRHTLVVELQKRVGVPSLIGRGNNDKKVRVYDGMESNDDDTKRRRVTAMRYDPMQL